MQHLHAPVNDTAWTGTLRDLVALTKPKITLMVVVTSAAGMWLAPGHIAIGNALATLFAVALVVGSANALDRFIERDVDRHMTRTRNRPLPDRRLEPRVALICGTALAIVAVPLLFAVSNLITACLSTLSLLSYVLVYTPMKRRSSSALLIGAVPGALPPLIGWTAVAGSIDAGALILFSLQYLWQLPHFIAIASFRKDEYTRAGIVVLPAEFGDRVARRRAALWAVLLIPVSSLLYVLGVAGPVFLAVALACGAVYAALSIDGMRAHASPRWARRVFVASLIYLPVVMAALALDAR